MMMTTMISDNYSKELNDAILRAQYKKIKPETKVLTEFLDLVQYEKDGKTYTHSTTSWDFKKGDTIPYFDVRLSYQLSGYKPINEFEGLDFNPKWFTEVREIKKLKGKYCDAKKGSKPYKDFWNRELLRCFKGLKVNGYKITGDHYFFLNYYILPIVDEKNKAGSGRPDDFPDFYTSQYEYFHYIELCRILGYDAVGLKARGVGFSEIAASIAVNTYTTRRHTNTLIVAQQERFVKATTKKCWKQLDNLNINTEGGFRRSRVINREDEKKSGYANKKGEIIGGYQSSIKGIPADVPNKIRGDRTEFLLYEESGSWTNWVTAWTQGEALVFTGGSRVGIRVGWGTGGDSGPALEGISKAYSNPYGFDILPFRHNYTSDKNDTITAFFIPAYKQVTSNKEFREETKIDLDVIDNRGWTNPEFGKQFYTVKRLRLKNDPATLLLRSAEYCFTAEEALAMEGENIFDKILLSHQALEIKLGNGPDVQRGTMDFIYPNNDHSRLAIGGKFIPGAMGKVHILEEPERDENGEPYHHLYVAGIDSIDMGQKDTSSATKDPSEFCIVIKKRTVGIAPAQYVAYYKDRPHDVREAYKIALSLLMYYNARAVLEYTKISIKEYFEDRKALQYLMRRTQSTMKTPNPNVKTLGVPATVDVIQHYLELIAAYITDYSSTIWFEELVKQMLSYSFINKGKFDMIAAMGMCELADEELRNVIPISKKQEVPETEVLHGYYYDENGYKRYGAIPKKNQINVNFEQNDSGRIRTSDTRIIDGTYRARERTPFEFRN